MAKKVIVTVIITTLWLILAGRQSGFAQSPTPLSACTTISASGSYQIAADFIVTDPADGACFIIKANDVTLDGNNKTVTVNRTSELYPAHVVDVRDSPDNDGYYQNWHDVSVSYLTSNAGVRIYGDGVHNVTFDHLTVSEIGDLGGDDVTITNNTVGEGGISITNNSVSGWYPFRPIVRNNTVTGGSTDVAHLFVMIGGSCGSIVTPTCPAPAPGCPRLDAIIDHNTFTATRNDPPPGATSAVKIACATHTTFTDNTVSSTGTALGLYLRDESDDGVYEDNTFNTNTYPSLCIAAGNADKTLPARNTFHNNDFRTEAGYGVYTTGIGSDNVFTYNTFYADDVGHIGYIGSITGNTFDHNTFYNAATGGQTFSLIGNNIDGPPADTYTNNIFSYNGSQIFGYDQWLASRYNGGDYNIFYNRGGVLSFGFMGSFAAWKTGTGDDAHSINADPLLNNPAGGDFSLQVGSPALSAASNGTNIGAWQSGDIVVCTESWSCSDWSVCVDGTQTRSCADANNCGTTITRPALTQSCVVADTAAPATISDLRAL